MAAEDAAELFEALDGDRLVQRPALGATDERYDGRRDYRNDFSAVCGSVGAGAEVDRFGRHSARASEKRCISWRRQRLASIAAVS